MREDDTARDRRRERARRAAGGEDARGDRVRWIATRFAGCAPFVDEPLAAIGGPRAILRGQGAVALVFGAARFEAERRGLALAHPLAPRVLESDARDEEGALLVESIGAVHADPARAVSVGPEVVTRFTETRRALLAALSPERRVGRALVQIGLRRRDVDRWLDARVTVATRVGLCLGGIDRRLIRESDGGPIALRWDRARPDGWLALDLAALALGAEEEVDRLRDAHRAAVGAAGAASNDQSIFVSNGVDRDQMDEAFSLALVVARLRDAERAPETAEALCALVAPEPAPAQVRVFIDGPSFVPPALWEPPGALVDAARARWLLANVDGLAVGGGRLTVRTEPPLRAGRRAPPREPLATRRRRLFSRWAEGVDVDDEGLVGATPEALAMAIAEGARGVVLDGTCGVGGLTIAYARQPGVEKVLAVDRDRGRLAMARHNAALYGVADRIEWIGADVLDVLGAAAEGALRTDLLVLDPPWGGRGWDRERTTLDDLGLDVAAVARAFSGPIVLKLPRSFDVATLPGAWRVEPMVDERGILKMLIARREGSPRA